MGQHSSRLVGRLMFLVLLVGGCLVSAVSFSQTLPHLRTTFVARNTLQSDPCYEFACFSRSSYDRNTLAAIGATYPNDG